MLEPSFNQMQVNHAIELGFADGVRALMRQDPDIIMIGEIRDQDTANILFRLHSHSTWYYQLYTPMMRRLV